MPTPEGLPTEAESYIHALKTISDLRAAVERLQEQADREHRAWEAIRSGAVVVARRTDYGPGDDETFFLARRLRSTDAKRRADPVDAVLAALEAASAAGKE